MVPEVVTLLYNIKSEAMADNNRTELVDTGARKQLVEQDYGLVEEVKMLRQHMEDMYQAWMTGNTPPPPPPSFLNSVLTQAPDTITDDPPYSPYLPTYNSFPSHPSSSNTRRSTISSQHYSPPQCHFSPQDSQKHASLSQYPAPQNAYPPPLAYRKPPGSGFWPNQAFKNERF